MTDDVNQNNPPPRGPKVSYKNKKDAQSKLNYLSIHSRKKRPLRVYKDGNGWHLTKLQLIDNISLLDLITAALKYSDGKKFGKDMYKREWENEKRLRDSINKQLKILKLWDTHII